MEAKRAETDLSQRLRRLISSQGQSLKAFSNATGLAYRTLQDYLGGKAKPGADQLARIAASGIDVNFLLTGKPISSFQRLSSMFAETEDQYYLVADNDVAVALNKIAMEAVDIYAIDLQKNGITLSFEHLFDIYLAVVRQIMSITVSLDFPVAKARELRMPVGPIVSSMVQSAVQIFAARLAAEVIARQPQEPPADVP